MNRCESKRCGSCGSHDPRLCYCDNSIDGPHVWGYECCRDSYHERTMLDSEKELRRAARELAGAVAGKLRRWLRNLR